MFFCAPDEDVRTFADETQAFPLQAENRTLFAFPDDKAVAASKWLHQHDRVGIVPPVRYFAGIESIAVTGVGLLGLGHGYFAAAEPVVLDMREAIETRKPTKDRKIPQPSEGHHVITVR